MLKSTGLLKVSVNATAELIEVLSNASSKKIFISAFLMVFFGFYVAEGGTKKYKISIFIV